MITDAIHDYVAGQLSGLWRLPKPQRRARLAELRRGVGHQPGDLPALWGSFLQELPKELWGRETAAGECREPSEAEWAVYLALTLYALHQQGEENISMNEKGCTLGRAVRLLAQNSAAAAQDWTESSVLRRFNALATADSMPEVSHYLRGMVQLCRGNDPQLKLASRVVSPPPVFGAAGLRNRSVSFTAFPPAGCGAVPVPAPGSGSQCPPAVGPGPLPDECRHT